MSTTTAPVRAKAPGKINVFMRVGARLDDGYHDVATAYQAVSLCEEVSARHADDFSVAFTGPIDTSGLAVDESNIAIKAARLLAAHTGYGGGVRLDVLKRVPIAGGMGGGSADAAATLVACDALWGTQLPKEELHRLAAALGADVPFALMGGTAVGTGRGDRLSPALASGTVHWVLAVAPFGLSTPAVYAELDAHRERHRDEIHPTEQPVVDTDVLQALRTGDPHQLAEALDNDLQVAALHLRPELAPVLELGERSGALAGIVSGSGPTVAFLTADLEQALSLQVTLSAARIDALRVFGAVAGARLITD